MRKSQKINKIIWLIAGLFVVVAGVGGYFLWSPVRGGAKNVETKNSSFEEVTSSCSSSLATSSSTTTSTTTSTTEPATSSTTPKIIVAPKPKVNAELTTYLNSLAGEPVGIFVQRLDEKINYAVNADEIFYGASVAKLPIIFYTVEQLQAGTIGWQTSYPYTYAVNEVAGAMVAGGTGSLQYEAYEGALFTVENLLTRTITESDNQASNMLSYYVGAQNGASFLSAIQPYYTFNQDSFTKNMTAESAANLMRAIYQNGLANSFFAQTNWQADKIGSLPYAVLHKIGINGAFNHDVGIVLAPKPYVLAILTNGYSDGQIAEIAARIDELIK